MNERAAFLRREPPPCWRKIRKETRAKAELFLRAREKFCVGASARFLKAGDSPGRLWYLGERDEISALLLQSGRSLFPVFDKKPGIPCPRFLKRLLGKIQVHAVQGLREDAECLESLMETRGYFAAQRIDYELMSLDVPPVRDSLKKGPPGLVLRKPAPEDTEALFALQAAYEQEEVLPKNADFNPAASRLNLEHILAGERVLVAELAGQVIGKINTSAESFTRCQIGGVYVRPDCRGLGIGAKMTAVFAAELLASGKEISLFVKKRNAAARAVYRKTGFAVLGDYRISYY